MSDFDSFSSHPVRQSSMPTANRSGASWRQVFKSAVEQSSWMRFRRGGQDSRPAGGRLHLVLQSFSNRKVLLISLLFVIVGALLVFGIIRYVTSPSVVKKIPAAGASRKSVLNLSGTAKPKPAPGKPFVAAPQQHLPLPTVWTQAQPAQQAPQTAVTPQMPQSPMAAPQTAPLASAPPRPLAPAKSPFTPLVYSARHEKHFGGSCSGQLTLNAAGLIFQCPGDPNNSFQVALNQIGAVDENGIELVSGKKYHFSIPGMTKSGEEQLFSGWLHQVR